MRLFPLGLLLAAVMLHAETSEYRIVPNEGSRLALEVFKTGFMSGRRHLFWFERFHGTLTYDSERPEAAQVQLVIEAASAALKDRWLSAKDFKKVQEYALNEMLAAGQHPEIRFSSGGIRAVNPDRYEVGGELSIRGIAKPVRVFVTLRPDPDGGLVFEGAARIKMTDYGLKPPSAALGLVGTKDEMAFSFLLSPTSVAP